MSQNTQTKQAFQHTAQEEKQKRAEGKQEDALNDALLHTDQHTGQQSILPTNTDDRNAADDKGVYNLLHQSGWHKDEIRRVLLVPRGTRLVMGNTYLDLRNPAGGELTAHGEEEVHDEWLVSKRDTDYEIWDKLKAMR